MRSKGPLVGNEADSRQSKPDFPLEAIGQGLREAVREAIKEHHRAGDPVAIWRDGRIVLLYPDGSTQPVEGAATTQAEE
jgi:hypothetical protein